MFYAHPLFHPNSNRFFSQFWEDDSLDSMFDSPFLLHPFYDDWIVDRQRHRNRLNRRQQQQQQQQDSNNNNKESPAAAAAADSANPPSSTAATAGSTPTASTDMTTQNNAISSSSSSRFHPRRVPRFEIHDDKDALVLRAETPGVTKENLKVSVHDGRLTISGEDKQEQKGDGFFYSSFGSFEHSWTLPQHLDRENLTANYADGVLNVRIPKRDKVAAPEPKNITIE